MAFEERSTNSIAQINVTPLVDVMLVLLVIFMVTAPILQQGISVNLPRVRATSLAGEERQVVLTVTAAGELFLNETEITDKPVGEKLLEALGGDRERPVFVRADAEVAYGRVMEVMAAIREAGVQRIGMVTEPPAETG